MTVHKLSAGDGYTYLTRQVASADERRAAGQSLADYYVARGNPPGAWLGKGAVQLGVSGSEVTEAQMRALFGRGLHPDGLHKLGAAYPSYADLAPYADRVAARVEEFTVLNGRSPSAAERNQVAATEARRGRRAVAGFDLVFTPVKSASVLWGLGDPEIRAAVEDAHHEAVGNALGWLEEHASFTRTGRGGVAQIDATGLVCAAFDHRESRAGDPDLHTHVAVANKVCGVDGKWRSLDARGLYALGVAASERYNTRFEDALTRRLGVTFTERSTGLGGTRRDGKRPVREIDGVPLELIRHFSRRRAVIETRYAELAADYRRTHGREPGPSTQLQLAQQATLETREAKTTGRTLAEQIADWTHQARTVLGTRALRHTDVAGFLRDRVVGTPVFDDLDDDAVTEWATELAAGVVRTVAQQRSTWTVWNIWAETERALRPLRFASPEQREAATRAVVEQATGPGLSIQISEPVLVTEAPVLVRTSDAQSVFVPHGSARYTTSDILLAEDNLVAAARSTDGPHLEPVVLDVALAIHEAATGLHLDPGQRGLVEAFALSPARVAVGIGPAGAGKTTAMQAFAQAWQTARTDGSGRVVPLATSSKAAQVLGAELGARAENLHKFLHEINRTDTVSGAAGPGDVDPWFRLRAGDVVLVDEAGMAGTLQLADLVAKATEAGAAVRLLGDPAQLASVDAGGALSLLESEVGATYLTDLHRFTDEAEGHATLALRSGDPEALRFYTDRDRIRAGSRELMLEDAYDAWASDVRTGKVSVLIAATRADVVALNARARLERVLAGQVAETGVALGDGNTAGVGDWVVTRTNARTLRYPRQLQHFLPGRRGRRGGRGRWVHNGDTWQITRTHADGSITVKHLANRGTVRLPTTYVTESVELAYASTAHRAQGTTTDTAHALVTPEMTREALYVASTRGRNGTTWYVATEPPLDLDCEAEPEAPRTPHEVLTAVLNRTGAEASATATIRTTLAEATSLRALVARYDHARDVAARDTLHHAVETAFADRPTLERVRITEGRGTGHLATVLADAVARGAHPSQLLRAARDLDDLEQVNDPALVLAARITDHPVTLGIPNNPPIGGPLPWLASPDVGHPGWAPYLQARARLIEDRVTVLGGLAAAYREQYAITTPTDPGLLLSPGMGTGLGAEPEPGTRQAQAYRHAAADLERTAPPPPAPTRRDGPAAPGPSRTPARNHQGPSLSR